MELTALGGAESSMVDIIIIDTPRRYGWGLGAPRRDQHQGSAEEIDKEFKPLLWVRQVFAKTTMRLHLVLDPEAYPPSIHSP